MPKSRSKSRSRPAAPRALADIRRGIDDLDSQLVGLLNRRAELAREIAKAKLRDEGARGSFYRPEREAEVLRRVGRHNAGPLPKADLARLFREIMSACRALEQPLTVAFLGPAGTFSQAAAHRHFGQSVNSMPCSSIDQVFRGVETGACDCGVVPVENSIEGVVNQTLDLLVNSTLRICGEVELRIHQHLLSSARKLETITKVYSHQQSLAQCRGWLDRNLPRAERIAAGSNAEAAKRAAGKKNSAAIAGETAAELYRVPIRVRNIEDESDNITRFLVLGREPTRSTGSDKTSVLFSTHNRPGALHAAMKCFADNGVNMVRIESRPSRRGTWDYIFFADVDGHAEDAPVAATLALLKDCALMVKVLGSYPRSQP